MKRVLSGFMGIALALSLFGCSMAPAAPQGETRTVTDMYGRSVTIPKIVKTIAATGSAARILTYAGVADRLIGVTRMDGMNDPGMPYTVVNAARFSGLALVGEGGSKDVCFVEELVTLQPDAVFCNMDQGAVEDLANKSGLPVIGLQYSGIFDDSVYQALTLVGEVMGEEEACAAMVSSLQGWEADLDDRTRDIPEAEKPTAYTGGVNYKGAHGFEGTHGMYPPFLAIGANNVADETGAAGAFLVDLEKVVVWDPEIIFLNPSSMDLVNEDYRKNPGFYDGLSAVKNGRVYAQLSYNYNSTNIEIAVADAYYAGKVMFPEAFWDVDPAAKADEIFETMLGSPFHDALKAAGMEFQPLTIGG